MPLLTGGATDWRTSILLNWADSTPPTNFWGVRTERWKYVELSTGERELYDLAVDPYELVNVAGDPSLADVQASLAAELQRLKSEGGVPPTPANRSPVASNDAYTAASGIELAVFAPGVLANDTDADGDQLSALLGTGPSRGTLALNRDGSFAYTSASGFSGTDTFTYRAGDGKAQGNAATVTITVSDVGGGGGGGAAGVFAAGEDAYVRSPTPTTNYGARRRCASTEAGRASRAPT